jgi:MFS family permease
LIIAIQERGKVLGIAVASVYIGLSCGPFFGGWLTQHFFWLLRRGHIFFSCPGRSETRRLKGRSISKNSLFFELLTPSTQQTA